MKTPLLVLPLLIVTGTAAAAQQTARPSFPDPEESAARAPGYLEVRAAFDQWNEGHGGHWRMQFEDRTQAASFLYGGSTPGSFVPGTDADYTFLAREFLAQTYPMHRVDPSTLHADSVVFLPLGLAGSSDKTTVRFEQQVQGVPVIGGSVNVLFDTQGRLLSIDVQALPDLAGFDTAAAVAEPQARAAAAQRFAQDAGVAPNRLELGRLEILKHPAGKFLEPRLVWDVNAQWFQEQFTEQGWRYRFDARSGELLDRAPTVHFVDVSGTVTSQASPGGDPDDGSNSVATPMPYITVTSTQGNAVADANGDFTIGGATAPLQVTVLYDGTYAVTNNDAGTEYSLTTTLNSASGNAVLMNPGALEYDTAEANSYNWISLMRDWTVGVNPADTTSNFQALSNVNQSTTCNATWSGSAVNFRAEAGGCVNSAYASVVLHEMGHWLNYLYGSDNGGDGFGEGNADVFAIYVRDDPIIGKDFKGPDVNIRDASNALHWCGSSCYGEVHADGEPLMGALWNVRQNLKATYGSAAGGVAANTLFNAWMNAYDDGQVGPLIRDHWLVLDDDNGNVNDGTPNFADIDGGFVQQSFPTFEFTWVLYQNVVEPQDTQDESGPYTVQADLSTTVNAPVMGAMLNYRVNGGAFQQVPMSFVSGTTYTADIPGQLSPAKVEWYIAATDGLSQATPYPFHAPTDLKRFRVGVLSSFFFDDFESGVGGWTHGLYQNQDDWQRTSDEGLSNGSAGLSGDPASAFSGTEIWGNDLGASGWNGAYQDDTDNWLRSPTIDLSGAVGATLQFERWLTVEGGQYDQARVLVNGTEVWVNPSGANTIDTSWVPMEIDISAFDGNPNVTIEFRLTSDGGLTFGGWNIDDVEIVTLVGSSSPGVAYCTAGISANGCQPAIGATGAPSASAPSGFSLIAAGVEGGNDGLFFYGTNGQQAAPWGNGSSFQCVVPPVRRAGLLSGNGANGTCNGNFAQDFNTLWNTKPAKNPGSGAVVQAQFWYRDPFNTSNQTTSFTNAIEFTVAP